MKTYEELIRDYRKRNNDTTVDAAAVVLPCLDELAQTAGVLIEEETAGLIDAAGNVLPFIVIAVGEGKRVLEGRKPAATAMRDCIRRMVKTTAALGVGAAAAAAMGVWAAVPAAAGFRLFLDKHRSRMTTGLRVQERTERLREISMAMAQQRNANMIESAGQERIPAEIVEII